MPVKLQAVASECAAFASHLRRTRAPGTAKKWSPHLEAFAEWCTLREYGLEDVSSSDIEGDFLDWWIGGFRLRLAERIGADGAAKRDPAPKTINGVYNALSGLYKYLDRHDRLSARNPMTRVERARVPRKPPEYLTQEESERLLLNGPASAQQRIVIWLLRWSGLRVGEAVSLRQRDADLTDGYIHVRKSKSAAGVRDIPIFAELRPELIRWFDYLGERGRRDEYLPFLCTRNLTKMAEFQVYKSVKLAALHAGVRLHRDRESRGQVNHADVSPHTLRRTFGTDLLNRDIPLEVVSRLLGHESTVTTQRSYAELQPATILRALGGLL